MTVTLYFYCSLFFIADEDFKELAEVLHAAGIDFMKLTETARKEFMSNLIDQILHDVCIQNLPVIFMVDRAGLVGNDGETHQGVFDISYLSIIPNLVILSPKCMEEVKPLIEYAISLNKPVVIRYPKAEMENNLKPLTVIKNNSWEVVSKGNNPAIIA